MSPFLSAHFKLLCRFRLGFHKKQWYGYYMDIRQINSLSNPNMNQDFFKNLPSEIIIDILSRLPVRTILCCKCVCKSWLDLVETQEFIKSHLSKSIIGLAVYQYKKRSKLYKIIEFEDGLDLQHNELHYNLVTNFSLPYHAWLRCSANGLIFLHDQRAEPDALYMCNIQLHCPHEFVYSYPQVVTYGFGASKISGQHKVVRIFHDQRTHALLRIPKFDCQVYTLGTGSWRSIAPGALLEYNCRTFGAFFNGNLHWLVSDLEGIPRISCFDLETEVFSTFYSPPPLRGSGRFFEGLVALEDCLCLCDNTSDDQIVIWLLKEYGVEKSWTKEFVIIKSPDLVGESYEFVCPIKIFKDGDILMSWEGYFFFYYSNKTKSTQKTNLFELHGAAEFVNSILYTPSFLSLKSFGMENVSSF